MPPDVAKGWAKHLGITSSQADAQLDLQRRGSSADARFRKALGRSYGGLIFDDTGNGRFIVSIASGGDRPAASNRSAARSVLDDLAIEAGEYEIRDVDYGVEELDAVFRELASKLEPLLARRLAGVNRDDRRNRVAVEVPKAAGPAAREAIAEAVKPFGEIVETVDKELPSPPQPKCGYIDDDFWLSEAYCAAPLLGGTKMYASNGVGCSMAGFASSAWHHYVLTAGHCLEPAVGEVWYSRDWPARTQRLIGPTDAHHWGLQGDWGVIRMDWSSPWLQSPTPFDHPAQVIWGYSPFWQTLNIAYPYVGQLVCWSGATSTGCIRVQWVNYAGTLSRRPTTWSGGTMIPAGTGCPRPGTSGGTVSDGNSLVGIVNGGDEFCNTMVFTPVNAVEYYTGIRVARGY